MDTHTAARIAACCPTCIKPRPPRKQQLYYSHPLVTTRLALPLLSTRQTGRRGDAIVTKTPGQPAHSSAAGAFWTSCCLPARPAAVVVLLVPSGLQRAQQKGSTCATPIGHRDGAARQSAPLAHVHALAELTDPWPTKSVHAPKQAAARTCMPAEEEWWLPAAPSGNTVLPTPTAEPAATPLPAAAG